MLIVQIQFFYSIRQNESNNKKNIAKIHRFEHGTLILPKRNSDLIFKCPEILLAIRFIYFFNFRYNDVNFVSTANKLLHVKRREKHDRPQIGAFDLKNSSKTEFFIYLQKHGTLYRLFR